MTAQTAYSNLVQFCVNPKNAKKRSFRFLFLFLEYKLFAGLTTDYTRDRQFYHDFYYSGVAP